MPVKIAEKYTLGGHELVDFKIDEKREFVRGNAGPYVILVNAEQEVVVIGRNEKKNRVWVAEYKENRFWITVYDGYEKWRSRVNMAGKDAQFSYPQLLDDKLFEKAGGKVKDGLIGMDDVRKALSWHEKGTLRLAERDRTLERTRLANLKDIAGYEAEIEEAAGLFDEAQRLKAHPEVLKLARGKGFIEERPVMTEEKAMVLTAIDSIAKSGEYVTPLGILEWLNKQSGAGAGSSELVDIMEMSIVLAEVGRDGYVQTARKGRELTDFGRKELKEYNNKKFSYVV
jgi:hypothetical protein